MTLQMTVKEGIEYIIKHSGKFKYDEKIECVEKFLKKFPHNLYCFGKDITVTIPEKSSYKRYEILDYTYSWYVRLAIFEVDGKLHANIIKSDFFSLENSITNKEAMELIERYYNLDELFPYDKYWDMIEHYPTWVRERKKLDAHQKEEQRILKMLGIKIT